MDLDLAGTWWLGFALGSALASVDCDKHNTKDKDKAYNIIILPLFDTTHLNTPSGINCNNAYYLY